MTIDPQEIDAAIEIAADLVQVLTPVIEGWIRDGNVDAIQALRGVVQDAATLEQLDRALVAAQRAKAAAELAP